MASMDDMPPKAPAADRAVPASLYLGLVARLCSFTVLAMTLVYAIYSSVHATSPDMALYGGLSGCFACNNGWNWHVVLLTVAFVVAMTESVLAFRAPVLPALLPPKWVHLAWQTAGFGCTVAGLVAILQAKIFTGATHMYSVHAWTGTIVLVGFFAQYVAGLVVFVLARGRVSPELRVTAGKWHSAIGRLVLFGGLGVCVNGWADIQMMNVDFGQFYYGSATMLGSACAVLIWAIGAALVFLLF